MFDLGVELSRMGLDGKTLTIDELLKALGAIQLNHFKDIPPEIRSEDLFLFGKKRGCFVEEDDGRIHIQLNAEARRAA